MGIVHRAKLVFGVPLAIKDLIRLTNEFESVENYGIIEGIQDIFEKNELWPDLTVEYIGNAYSNKDDTYIVTVKSFYEEYHTAIPVNVMISVDDYHKLHRGLRILGITAPDPQWYLSLYTG